MITKSTPKTKLKRSTAQRSQELSTQANATVRDPKRKFTKNFQGGKNFIQSLKSPQGLLNRQKKQEVKTAKGRKASSTRWLNWHLNDHYANLAKQEGYCSRASYKLLEINAKFQLIKPGFTVIDLGAAPGGWVQVTHKLVGPQGQIIGVDLLPIKPTFANLHAIEGNFLDPPTIRTITELLPRGTAHVVLSDMAPNTTGNIELDHLKILELAEHVLHFSTEVLTQGGSLALKFFHGAQQQSLANTIRQYFKKVKYFKPDSSRKASKEIYLVATDFRK